MNREYSVDDAHHLLCTWGAYCVALETGAQGYAKEASGLGDLRERPAQPLGPTDLAPAEFQSINDTVAGFEPLMRAIVTCYYCPGRLQFSGLDGYGRQKGISEQNVADALAVPASRVHSSLVQARALVAERLTNLG